MNSLRFFAAIVILALNSSFVFAQMNFPASKIHKHCPQEPVILKVENYRGEIQWQQMTFGQNWNNIPGATTGSYAIDPEMETAYRAAIIDGTCDTLYTDTLLVTIDVQLVATVTLTTGNSQLCEGESVTLNAFSAYGGDQPEYRWYVNGIRMTEAFMPVFTYTPANGDIVHVELISSEHCIVNEIAISEPLLITVNKLLQAKVLVSVDATEVCEGSEVTLTATPVNEGANPQFRWFLNGNELEGIQGTEFRYVPTNSDRIYIEMTSNHECVAEPVVVTEVITFSVGEIVEPKVNIQASNTEVCGVEEVIFTAISDNGGENPIIFWYVNGTKVDGAEGATFSYKPVAGDSIYAELTSDLKCVSQRTVQSGDIRMERCKTPALIVTMTVGTITHNSAECGGNITDDGNSFVVERGVCWSTQPEPTLDNNRTSDGTGTGPFTSTLTGLTENTVYYLRAYAVNSKGISYGETKTFTTDRTMSYSVTKPVVANLNDTIHTPGAVLVIPGNSLETSGNVTVTVDGKGVYDLNNINLEVVGEVFNITIPGNKILGNIYLSFPLPSINVPRENCTMFLFNGNTYYPIEFSIVEDTVYAIIDIIDWEQFQGLENKSALIFAEVAALFIVNKQSPSFNMLGIKKVNIKNNSLTFADPEPAVNTKKIILFVHGWIGDPTTWDVMIPKIALEHDLGYNEIWTFGYNSSWSIEENSRILLNELNIYCRNNKVDIVAHSMGGLVCRSMIEFYNGSGLVNKLITLGTPHLGSSLAALREVIGMLLVIDNKQAYNASTEGFNDLDINSSF